MSTVIAIPLAEVVDDAAAQMSVAGINPSIVDEYARAMQEGATFPPIIVYHHQSVYHVSDGFHRVAAARQSKLEELLAEVREGTARDAVLAAASANATLGLRRTNADKRHAVERLLKDPEWGLWSDREIARACHADHKTVGRVRRELTGEIPSERSVTYRDQHGNLTQMRVVTGEIPSERPTLTSRLLATIPTKDLIAELRRRGMEVPDAGGPAMTAPTQRARRWISVETAEWGNDGWEPQRYAELDASKVRALEIHVDWRTSQRLTAIYVAGIRRPFQRFEPLRTLRERLDQDDPDEGAAP